MLKMVTTLRRSTLFLILAGMLSAVPIAGAITQEMPKQQPVTSPNNAEHRLSRRRPLHRPGSVSPVALIHSPVPDFLTGEAHVTVRGNSEAVIRLGVARDGVTLIELPANDFLFALHNGNSDLVTIDDSPSKATDHFIVLRAGSGFTLTKPSRAKHRRVLQRSQPSTSLIVQMRSGMVLTFMFYPVAQVAEQAHRCIISYDRAEVVAARLQAGLAVNLDGAEPASLPSPQAASAAPAGESSPAVTAILSPPPNTPTASAPAVPATLHGAEPAPQNNLTTRAAAEVAHTSSFAGHREINDDTPDTGAAARQALEAALKEPKAFRRRWMPARHGLSIAALPARDLGEHDRLIVIAVRNTSAAAVHLVPGQPEITLETTSDQGTPVQTERITKLQTETTLAGNTIPAGGTIYYAVVYTPPIMGAKQRLRVSVAQTSAADEPVTIDLSVAAR